MTGKEQLLSEKASKFRDLAAHFFAQFRTDFLGAIDREGAIMNLREFLDKLNKVDISKLQPRSKIVFDKFILGPSKVDPLMGVAHQMLQLLADKEKIAFDYSKILLAFSASRLQEFVNTIDKELPGVLDEVATM